MRKSAKAVVLQLENEGGIIKRLRAPDQFGGSEIEGEQLFFILAAEPWRPQRERRKRTLSAAGRKRIAEAAKRRWASIRASKSEAMAPSEDEQFKKRMSEVMKASRAKRKTAADKKKPA